jgi:hypothetical protein
MDLESRSNPSGVATTKSGGLVAKSRPCGWIECQIRTDRLVDWIANYAAAVFS